MNPQALARPYSALRISVVVPTRNRPESLRRTLTGLVTQDLEPSIYEIIVVDDGSEPPVSTVGLGATPAIRVVRLEHGERSAARNAGAAHATGQTLVFVDDDMLVDRGLLRAHLSAQEAWPGSLATGAILLADRVLRTPFGRFRGELEASALPLRRGPVAQANFAAAGNLSLPRTRFLELGGFDGNMASSEDQDLALRHTAQGGGLVFLPDAVAVHDDSAVEPFSYWTRSEWGAEHMAPFCARYPERPENRARLEVNGPIRWGRDSPRRILMKTAKRALGARAPLAVLYGLTHFLEGHWPSSQLLPALYRLALGIHLQRGFRRGWATCCFDKVHRTAP
jgi:glycosyltransferase involved in cell wall biosynthesis